MPGLPSCHVVLVEAEVRPVLNGISVARHAESRTCMDMYVYMWDLLYLMSRRQGRVPRPPFSYPHRPGALRLHSTCPSPRPGRQAGQPASVSFDAYRETLSCSCSFFPLIGHGYAHTLHYITLREAAGRSAWPLTRPKRQARAQKSDASAQALLEVLLQRLVHTDRRAQDHQLHGFATQPPVSVWPPISWPCE